MNTIRTVNNIIKNHDYIFKNSLNNRTPRGSANEKLTGIGLMRKRSPEPQAGSAESGTSSAREEDGVMVPW